MPAACQAILHLPCSVMPWCAQPGLFGQLQAPGLRQGKGGFPLVVCSVESTRNKESKPHVLQKQSHLPAKTSYMFKAKWKSSFPFPLSSLLREVPEERRRGACTSPITTDLIYKAYREIGGRAPSLNSFRRHSQENT